MPNILLFAEIAFKPRAAVKFATFRIVPINVPCAQIGAEFAKFNQVRNVPVFPGPWAFWAKKNYCGFDYFGHFQLFLQRMQVTCGWFRSRLSGRFPSG